MNRLFLAAALAASCHASMQGAQAAETIRAFGPESFKQIVAGKEGKPFVVLLWSLDCAYCTANFEVLSEAKKKFGVEVVTIAVDPVDDADSVQLINKKLSTFRLNANAWAFGSSPQEQLRYAIDPKWRGELPRSYWFSRDGKVVAHSGLISKEMISPLMAK